MLVLYCLPVSIIFHELLGGVLTQFGGSLPRVGIRRKPEPSAFIPQLHSIVLVGHDLRESLRVIILQVLFYLRRHVEVLVCKTSQSFDVCWKWFGMLDPCRLHIED